jgi:hypothetical protein
LKTFVLLTLGDALFGGVISIALRLLAPEVSLAHFSGLVGLSCLVGAFLGTVMARRGPPARPSDDQAYRRED